MTRYELNGLLTLLKRYKAHIKADKIVYNDVIEDGERMTASEEIVNKRVMDVRKIIEFIRATEEVDN